MAVLGELLFYRRDQVTLDDALRNQIDQGVRKEVDSLPDTIFSTQTDDDLTQKIVAKLSIAPINLSLDKAKADVKETNLDVRNAFREQVRVKGLRATKTIPFTGESELWNLCPNPWDANPPHGQIVGNTLILGMDVREHEAEQAASHIAHSIQRVNEYLKRQEVQIATFNTSLPSKVMPHIQARRARLGAAADLLKKLQG